MKLIARNYLFVKNIPMSWGEDELSKVFSKIAPPVSVFVSNEIKG